MFCCDRMSGSQFIVQTSKFLLIDTTDDLSTTLTQGHGKVIQYILQDLYNSLPQISKMYTPVKK